MNKEAIIFSLLFLCTIHLQAQPGGGGGLVIRGIYDLKGIEISNDPDLKLRAFALADSSDNPAITEELYLEEKSRFNPHIKLEPKRSTLNSPNIRLMVMSKSDTMIVDFFSIIPGNPIGLRDRLDSLSFKRGYFHFPRNTRREITGADKVDTIVYKRPVDLSFLLEKNLPVSFYLRKAKQLLRNDQPRSALEEVQKAIAKDTKQRHGGILELQYEIYKRLKEHDKSIDAINKLIKMQTPVKNDDHYKYALIDDYKKRIDLYSITGQPRKAINDYTEIIKIYPLKAYDFYYVTKRAALKIMDLGDYTNAIRDLKSIIDTISIELSGIHLSNRSFSDEYFLLGLAEYKRNNLQLAVKYWCKDGEFGNSKDIIHFDSLIIKHPDIPELYLARAMNIRYKWMSDTLQIKQTLCENALSDLDLAEKLGSVDFRINLCRAGILNAQQKYDDALTEVNLAIEKNPTDPRMYWHRSSIKSNQNRAKHIYNNQDPDIIKYEELKKNWVFERY